MNDWGQFRHCRGMGVSPMISRNSAEKARTSTGKMPAPPIRLARISLLPSRRRRDGFRESRLPARLRTISDSGKSGSPGTGIGLASEGQV